MDSFAEKNNFRQNRELSTYLYERPYNFLKEDTPATLVHRPEKFIAISILREDFYRLHFLGSSYISRRREEKTWRRLKRDKDKKNYRNDLDRLSNEIERRFFDFFPFNPRMDISLSAE